jgi:hypothetical protein
MRMTASWSGSNDPTAYKSVTRRSVPNGELPSDPQPDQTRSYAKKPALLFIVAPRAQASRRCETQAPLGGTPPKLCYRFGPLPPSARSANLIAGDGMKNGFPAPDKEPTTNQKHHLTGKAPYRFESTSLQQGVCLCTELYGRTLKRRTFARVSGRRETREGTGWLRACPFSPFFSDGHRGSPTLKAHSVPVKSRPRRTCACNSA